VKELHGEADAGITDQEIEINTRFAESGLLNIAELGPKTRATLERNGGLKKVKFTPEEATSSEAMKKSGKYEEGAPPKSVAYEVMSMAHDIECGRFKEGSDMKITVQYHKIKEA
jgi:hypothetical protein